MKAYAVKDPFVTYKIGVMQERFLDADPQSKKVWETIDSPSFWASIVFRGIYLNRRKWKDLADGYRDKADEIQAKLKFNLNAPGQVKAALADAGVYVENTREDTLIPHAGHKLVDMILAYREAATRAQTFGENLFEFIEEDDRIYPEFNMVGAETGRTSCNGPNLQNQPREETYRGCYQAMRGYRLGIFDYGQQEMRLSAQLSLDPGLLEAFELGEDIYTHIIRKVKRDPSIKKSDKKKRQLGKTVGLSLNYGLTEFGMVEKVPELTLDSARQLVADYFIEFPLQKQYLDRVWFEAQQDGFVRTPSGRRIWVNVYGRGGRNNSYNGPMQGGGADMIKLAIAKFHAKYGDKDFPIIGPIHDELLVEARTDKINRVAKDVERCMTEAFVELCPNVSTKGLVDGHIGKTWADKG